MSEHTLLMKSLVVGGAAAVPTLTTLLHNRTRYFKIFDNFYRILFVVFSIRFVAEVDYRCADDDDVANGRIGIWTMRATMRVSLTKSFASPSNKNDDRNDDFR